jgi:RimJ/RimL family protein N-acetyltransferase
MGAMSGIEGVWPLFGLRLRIGDLELRVPRDDDLAELAELTREPLHDPATTPFFVPWTDEPEDRRVRGTLQWHWRCRAEWSPDDWRLELVASRRGEIVGTQGMHARHFVLTREVETGSWVGRRHQGQGVATAMRRATLHLAFAGLGATRARSAAFEDNAASLAVSEKLGYRRDGTETHKRRDRQATIVRLLLCREQWTGRAAAWPQVDIEGLPGCLAEFGLDPGGQ